MIPIVMAGVLLTASTVVGQVTLPSGGVTSPAADSRSVVERAKKTIIRFELLTVDPLSGGVHAHEWAETLHELDADAQIRRRRAEDEVGVSEKTRGTLRWVTVTGVLDTSGGLVMPDRRFTPSDTDLLREWINELKLYGAQGAPEGKPLWGLSKAQFEEIYTALSTPIPQDVSGETLTSALKRMNLPATYPVRFHSTATEHQSRSEAPTIVKQRLEGVSSGTGLAAVLADVGLGFRPLRTPAGTIELVVQPLTEISNPWPVGWDVPKETSRFELAPELFTMVQVRFNDIPLQDVFDDIARTSGRPIIVDHYGLAQNNVDLTESTLSYPNKRVAWMQVLHSAAVRNRMTEELRIDERGRPFVHISPFNPLRITE